MKPFESEPIRDIILKQSEGVFSKPLKLWEPEASSYLSLLFTPVFGALLHASNWNRLKNNELVILNFASIVGYFILMSAVNSFATYLLYYYALEIYFNFKQSLFIFSHLALWFAWHYFLASQQIKLVKEQKIVYKKRNLWIPILIIVGIPMLFAIAFVIWLTTVVF